MYIQYSEIERYTFAREFRKLSLSDEEEKRLKDDPDQLAFELADGVLARLLERINSKTQSVVLPSLKTGRCMVTAPTLRQLELIMMRIGRLLIPTYAVIDKAGRKEFDEEKQNSIQQLGKKLYPSGYYYVLRFNQNDTQRVLERLDLWMQLEDESHHRTHAEARPTYGTLYERFRSALATSQWEIAEQIRQQLSKANLTTSDNLLFLEIEQLAQQQRWSEINSHRDFSLLTRMHIPRAVRASLLIAFHQAYLLGYEQQGEWEQAIESFRNNQPKLGQLLTARLGLKQDPVLQVYAYQATLESDQALLLTLRQESSNIEVQECIDQLLHLSNMHSEPVIAKEKVPSVQILALDALYQRDYDSALSYASEIPELIERTGLLLQIAYHTNDPLAAEKALFSYRKLSTTQKNDLQQRFPSVEDILGQLQQIIGIDDNTKEQFTISDWLTWFERVQQHPDDPELLYSSARLTAVSDERYWTVERIVQLNKLIMQILVDQHIIKQQHVRDVLRKLVEFFVTEETFPQTDSAHHQLYETLYVALLENPAKEGLLTGFILLRLAEVQLRHAPKNCYAILQNLKEWSGDNPIIPELEGWALEAFELLIDYGLQPGNLIDWYRSWISSLLSVRTQHKRTNLEGWRIIGNVIQPGQDIIKQLNETLSLTLDQEASRPIEELPSSYRIAIYSLQVTAAERARNLLIARNPYLDIRICADEVLSKSAKINAQNADLVVLVTTAMKHALSYGISSSLKSDQVVYAEGSGSTSILRAVEEFARKSSNL